MKIQKVINRWQEQGGVINYNTHITGDKRGLTELYIMDDGEFEDMYNLYIKEKQNNNTLIMNKDDYAKYLCETALRMVNTDEERIKELVNW